MMTINAANLMIELNGVLPVQIRLFLLE